MAIVENILASIEADAAAVVATNPQAEASLIFLHSCAISLKRIADRVDAAGSGDGLQGLHGFVTNLAYEAGTNFEAGKRRA